MSTESVKSAEPATAGSVKYARRHMDADTKALVTKLIGKDRMDDFLAPEEKDGEHNPDDYACDKPDDGEHNSDDYYDEKSDDRLTKRFKHVFADMLIAAAPQAAQRKLSVTSPVRPALEISPAAAAAATIIDKMCPYDLHAEQIAKKNEHRDDGGMELYLWKLWLAFLKTVKLVPYDNPLQYELLGFLKNLGSKSRGTVHVWGERKDLWADLPIYGGMVREDYIPPSLELHDLEDSLRLGYLDCIDGQQKDFADYLQKWTNFAAFNARDVVMLSEGGVGPLLYGVDDIANALEDPPSEQAGPKDRIVASRQASFACNVRVACNWMLIAGRTMYRFVIRDIDDNLEKGTACLGNEISLRIIRKCLYDLYPQSGGSKDDKHIKRWLFWQKRFEVLGSNDESDPDSGIRLGLEDTLRADARLAAQRMDDYMAQVDAELDEQSEGGD